MRRRDFLAAFAGTILLVAGSPSAPAQARMPRIGILSPLDPSVTWFADGLREGFRQLGYVEGRNIAFEFRWANGQFERLNGLAIELAALEVDVIIAGVTQASLAAQAATRTIPIVMVGVGDPVAVGLAASLPRPGGNITGTSTVAADIVGKQLELLRELNPRLARIGVLWNPDNGVFQSLQIRQAELAGYASGVELLFLAARGPGDFSDAIATLRREKIDSVLILADPLFNIHRQSLSAILADARLRAVSGFREFAAAGGLMAYGADYVHASRRAAVFVDRILKGTSPAEMPIEQADQFELVINLKTAQALEIEIPAALLARADEVIE